MSVLHDDSSIPRPRIFVRKSRSANRKEKFSAGIRFVVIVGSAIATWGGVIGLGYAVFRVI